MSTNLQRGDILEFVELTQSNERVAAYYLELCSSAAPSQFLSGDTNTSIVEDAVVRYFDFGMELPPADWMPRSNVVPSPRLTQRKKGGRAKNNKLSVDQVEQDMRRSSIMGTNTGSCIDERGHIGSDPVLSTVSTSTCTGEQDKKVLGGTSKGMNAKARRQAKRNLEKQKQTYQLEKEQRVLESSGSDKHSGGSNFLSSDYRQQELQKKREQRQLQQTRHLTATEVASPQQQHLCQLVIHFHHILNPDKRQVHARITACLSLGLLQMPEHTYLFSQRTGGAGVGVGAGTWGGISNGHAWWVGGFGRSIFCCSSLTAIAAH
jgi:hypothetical protein